MSSSTEPEVRQPSGGAGASGVLWIALSLSLGHTASDFYSNFATVQLDLLKAHLSVSEFVAASLPVPMAVLGSLAQPLFGILGDVYGNRRIQAALGIACSAVFVALMGVATSGLQVLVLLALGGIGIGWFHPNGVALVRHVVPGRQGFCVSMFLGGGVIGLLLTPLVARHFYQLGSWWSVLLAVVPGLLIALGVYRLVPSVDVHEERSSFRQVLSHIRGPLALVFVFATLRAFAFTAPHYFMTFYGKDLGWSKGQITTAILLWFAAGAAGNFLGMHFTDRHHWRGLLNWSCVLSAVFIMAAYGFSRPGFLVLAGLASLTTSLGMPPTVIVAQRAAPGGASFSSAMVMGAAWGLSGLLMPLLVPLAKATSYGFALRLTGLLMLVAMLVVRPLGHDARLSADGA